MTLSKELQKLTDILGENLEESFDLLKIGTTKENLPPGQEYGNGILATYRGKSIHLTWRFIQDVENQEKSNEYHNQ